MWRASSVRRADFSCHGRREYALLGTTRTDIVVAIFASGLQSAPAVLRYSTEMRDPRSSRLIVESSDTSPDTKGLRGYEASATCKGLALSDGRIDAAHIYWNHDTQHFDEWVR
jgi:hypothetical protein